MMAHSDNISTELNDFIYLRKSEVSVERISVPNELKKT